MVKFNCDGLYCWQGWELDSLCYLYVGNKVGTTRWGLGIIFLATYPPPPINPPTTNPNCWENYEFSFGQINIPGCSFIYLHVLKHFMDTIMIQKYIWGIAAIGPKYSLVWSNHIVDRVKLVLGQLNLFENNLLPGPSSWGGNGSLNMC